MGSTSQATVAARAPRTRILLAVSPSSLERLRRVLAGHELVSAQTLDEASGLIDEDHFGMIIAGVSFDESQMFDLIYRVRSQERHRTTPVVCVLGTDSALSDVALEGIDHAVKAMMGNAFLDLRRMPDDDSGNARIRRIIDYLILIDGDLHQGATW
jgi:PleD family two-component response regulator